MKITDELWEAFGFEKKFAYDRWGYVHKNLMSVNSCFSLMFFDGIGTEYGSKVPETIEELLEIMRRCYYDNYVKVGENNIKYQIRNIIGIE